MDSAILRGVTRYLQSNLSTWTVKNCKAMPDGRPDPVMGDSFCSVHMTEAQGTTDDQGLLREVYGFGITVTQRITAVSYDRLTDSVYLSRVTGIAALVDQIRFAVSNRWEVSRAIEAAIPTPEEDPELFKFIDNIRVSTPPIFVSRNPKFRFRDEDWMHGTHSNPARDNQDGHIAMSFTLSFGRLNFEISQAEGNC